MTQCEALVAVSNLLLDDLNKTTYEQWERAREAVQTKPSMFMLMLSVKKWARALADVCRSHARECARVHANCGEEDPKEAAVGTISQVVADHLQQNTVRDFVLEVASARWKRDKRAEARLPRWEPKGKLARLIAGLPADPPKGQDAAFLSVNETRTQLCGLEESFVKTLAAGLEASRDESVLELSQGSNDLGFFTDAAQPGKLLVELDRLPQKKQDLSQYLNAAHLTERQMKCFSLRWEYELTKAEIARRMGITRKTVDEHIAAATRKIERSRSHERRKKEAAKSNRV